MKRKILPKQLGIKSATVSAFFKCILVILVGLFIFWIDDRAFFSPSITAQIIVALAVLKCTYFLWIGYQKVIEVSESNTAYHHFLVFVVMNISVLVLSFGIDFWCLYWINPKSFVGIDPTLTIPEQLFETWYFSVLNYSFFGYGEIMPRTIPAKMVLILETIISFLTIILVLSDFISLKESLAEERERRKKWREKDTIPTERHRQPNEP